GHRDDHPAALAHPLVLEATDAAEFGEHLLRRLLADVAGVENDEIGAVRPRRRLVPERSQRFGHARSVIDVHLTAVGLDEEPFLHGHPWWWRRKLRDHPSAAAALSAAALSAATGRRSLTRAGLGAGRRRPL